jgi:hypothetical protein
MLEREIIECMSTEGRRYLDMLGLGQYADQEIETENHGTIRASEFLSVCGEHAIQALVGYETWVKTDDPRRHKGRIVLRGMVGKYLGLSEAELAE